MSFGERLRLILRVRGLTQKELAKRLETKECAVSRWIANARIPKITYILKIAKMFDISVETLWVGNDLFDTMLIRAVVNG